jgi:uncharacterized protein GlcG (DUF336 family)
MMKNKIVVVAMITYVFIVAAPRMVTAQTVLTERSISLNAAIEAATASLERCRSDGYRVTVTVLNRHVRTSVVISDDGASPHTIENSMRKAYTAFTTHSPSLEIGKRPQSELSGFLLLDKMTTVEGGLPIFAARTWSAQ